MELYPGAQPCLRSGYCCKKATCMAGILHGAAPVGCSFLLGDQPGNYRCLLVERQIVTPEDLAIGAGCCSPLNTDRIAARKYKETHG